MPLSQVPIAPDLVTRSQSGTEVALNRTRYPEFKHVLGEPILSARNPAFDAAAREAFAALQVVRKMAGSGSQQRVFLGEAAVHLIYGRPKQPEEKDCDVVGYVLRGKGYGYWLAEGKGDDIPGAAKEFEAVEALLHTRCYDPHDADDPRPGPVFGGLIVTHRLRYLAWHSARRQWIAYNGVAEDAIITARLQPNISRARPTIQQEKVYLLDGPEAADQLSLWAITPAPQPWAVWTQERRTGERGQFHPLRIVAGSLELHFVC